MVTSCTGRVHDVVKNLRCVYISNKFRPNYLVCVYSLRCPFLSRNTNLVLVNCCVKGQRFCTLDRHRISVQDCTFPDGVVCSSCEACIAKHGDEEASVPTLNADFDRNENMVVNLPDKCSLSDRESLLLQTLNRKIDDVKFQSCNVCLEDAFNLSLVHG